MFSKFFRLKSRLRLAATILIGLMFALSSAGAMAHCLEAPQLMKSSASDKGQARHNAAYPTDEAASHHGSNGQFHDHSKKNGGTTASVCIGAGMALAAQCKLDIMVKPAAAYFALTAQSALGMSVTPPSEPPRI